MKTSAARILNSVETALGSAVFLLMFTSVLLQIFYRYVLGNPLTWPFELSVYCYIYLVYIGSVMATRSNTHVAFDLLYERLPLRVRLAISALSEIFIALVFIALIPSSIGYIETFGSVKASSLPVTWSVLLVVFPICMGAMALIMLVRAVLRARDLIKGGQG